MNKGRFSISPFAVLLGALLYCTASFSELAALLPPVIVHELGHIVALRLYGLRIRRVSADLRGLCIEYGGICAPLGHAVSALAGPAAGFAYAFAASFFAARNGNELLTLSAGISLLLSLFNLLPILPLDGGRIFSIIVSELLGSRRGDMLTKALSLTLSTALLMAGTWLMWRGEGTALTLAALWLLLAQPDKAALVKRRELL
ncbi:MAG: site-2 protease family protein [Oscillospiraceae bacterium]|nr:site-2 protease family protein [Oscillospiraceae bacterium]